MNEKNYEGELNFMMMLVSLRRHWKTIVYFLISFAIIGYVYGYKISKTTYKSTGDIGVNSLDRNKYSTIISSVSSKNIYEIIYTDLKDNEVKHANGQEITEDEIKSGLVIPDIPSTISGFTISFSFSNLDKEIVKPVLSTTLEKIVENNKTEQLNLYVASEPTTPTATSNPKKKVVLVTGVGICLGILVAAFKGLRKYEVDTTSELTDYGLNVFEIDYKEGKKHE